MDSLLARLSDSLVQAKTLEQLTRPLLEMLEKVTQLESTYLTTIDFQQDMQHVLYARNSHALQIPEGLSVPWGDTLCHRALREGRMFTPDVQACWGDSQAAAALGIQTYVSTPVCLSDGAIYGTLCAASAQKAEMGTETAKVLQLFAGLIAQQVEREQLLQSLQQKNQELAHLALVDSLTGLPNRRALLEEYQRLQARAQRSGERVLVAFIDLDGFKQINDVYGHEVGDALLRSIAAQLRLILRDSDCVARLGGDEFVFVGPGPAADEDMDAAVDSLHERLQRATVCHLALEAPRSLNYPGASIGVFCADPEIHAPDEALRLADVAMYEAKQQRRAQRH